MVSLLHEKDLQGKLPFDYAEEEAQRKRHPDLFNGHRWKESLQNLNYAKDYDLNDSENESGRNIDQRPHRYS